MIVFAHFEHGKRWQDYLTEAEVVEVDTEFPEFFPDKHRIEGDQAVIINALRRAGTNIYDVVWRNDDYVLVDPPWTMPTQSREWMTTGIEWIKAAFKDGRQYHRPYFDSYEKARIEEQIAELKWRKPEGSMPMSPALMLQELVKELKIPRVSAVAFNGYLTYPDGPETGHYSLLGIEATYKDGRIRLYWLDIGMGAVPLATDRNVLEPILGRKDEPPRD